MAPAPAPARDRRAARGRCGRCVDRDRSVRRRFRRRRARQRLFNLAGDGEAAAVELADPRRRDAWLHRFRHGRPGGRQRAGDGHAGAPGGHDRSGHAGQRPLDAVGRFRDALAGARDPLADQQQEGIECTGDSSAQSAASGGSGSSGGSGACASDAQLVASGQQSVSGDGGRVAADKVALSSAERTLATDQAALASATAQASVFGPSSAYSSVPSPGKTVRRGQALFAIDGDPELLMYGTTNATRAFTAGMSPGADVAELNANLDALGYGHGLTGDTFTSATAAAIRQLQAAHSEYPRPAAGRRRRVRAGTDPRHITGNGRRGRLGGRAGPVLTGAGPLYRCRSSSIPRCRARSGPATR